MDSITAGRIVKFVNSHDDGTPAPRAHYDAAADAVVIKSFVVLANGTEVTETDSVRSLGEARDVLGY